MLSLTHLARSRAISQGCTYRLNFDTEEGIYWLTVQEGGAFVEIEGDYGRHFRLPVGVSIALDAPSDEEELSYVRFYPDGRCDAATIELAGGEGDVLQVICPSASERFRIISPTDEERL